MTPTLGNAAAPRWWDLDPRRLASFLGWIVDSGATAVEFVLHAGPADERTRRVHLLEEDWTAAFRAARAAGLQIHLHASLDPRFVIADPAIDSGQIRSTYRPLLDAAIALGEHQDQPVALTIHACTSNTGNGNGNCTEPALRFLDWAVGGIADATGNARICVELRTARNAADVWPDRSRNGLLGLVEPFDQRYAGLCWDVAHDWENDRLHSRSTIDPDPVFLARVVHVHIHDAAPDGSVHYPMGEGRVPWQRQLANLAGIDYTGSVIMEIRYRYAHAVGEPWQVLRDSYRAAGTQLAQLAAGVCEVEAQVRNRGMDVH